MPSPLTVFVTGANRGIGLNLVKQLNQLPVCEIPEVIFATYRKRGDAEALFSLAKESSNVRPVQLDVCDESSYQKVVDQVSSVVGDKGLNLLVHNAGVLYRPGTIESSTQKEFLETYEINAVAPVLLTKAFLPLLRKAAKAGRSGEYSWATSTVVNVGAHWGSIAGNTAGGVPYAYGMSKSALNFATKSLSIDLKPDKILVVSIHPGWVRTDMGGANAMISTEDSVAHMLGTLPKMSVENNGGFFNYDGRKLEY